MKSTSNIRIFISLLFTILFFSFNLTAQTTEVKGKLLDVNEKPSRYALVGIANLTGVLAENFASTDAQGNYSIKVTRPGQNFLLYSIPSHSAVRVPVLNNKDKNATINVTLAPYKYLDNIEDVFVAGSFNDFDISAPEKMTKGPDGLYTFEAKSDLKEIKYQLCKITKDSRTINAPGTSGFEPDSSGDYRSTLQVIDGKATIVFDPAKLLKGDQEYKVEFIGSDYDKKMFNYTNAHTKITSDMSQKLQEYVKVNKSTQNFKYDGGNYFQDLLSNIETESDPLLTDYLKLLYITYSSYRPAGYSFEKATAFFGALQPDNPAWDLMPGAFFSYYSLVPQYKWNELQDKFLAEAKSSVIKISILSSKLANAKFSGNEEELKKLHAQIQKDYPDLKEAQDLLKRYPIESKIKVGVEIPDFEVASLDNSAEKFSKQNMLGKIYMIDFWATWCGPCVAEMDALHKAYEKFKDKGFELLSLSIDGAADDVIKFRNDKWKMPWRNSFIGDKEGRLVASKFEVIGIPRPILVGADGKILAMEGELRSNNLQQTLAKYFK